MQKWFQMYFYNYGGSFQRFDEKSCEKLVLWVVLEVQKRPILVYYSHKQDYVSHKRPIWILSED